MNHRIGADFSKRAFENKDLVDIFSSEVERVKLWKSEEILIKKYIADKSTPILDAACGAGRISFSLYKMGYRNLTAYDFSTAMICACKEKAKIESAQISFDVADSCNLPYADSQFGACVYAFNGIMNIPQRSMRAKAFSEIFRVTKTNAIFVFDAFCMKNPPFLEYWKDEKQRWQNGTHDARLHEFGDLIFKDSRSNHSIESFVHVPVEFEVEEETSKAGFDILYTAMRSEIAEETQFIKDNFGEVRFWVCHKP